MNLLELGLLEHLQEAVASPFLDAFFPLVTKLGNSGWIWIVVALVYLIFAKTRRAGVTLSATLICEYILVNLSIKPLVGRVRPYELSRAIELLVVAPGDASFPSGHAAVSFAAAYVIYRYNRVHGIVAYVVATLIALSRLYLLLHFPTDVIGGIVIGTLVGVVVVAVLDRLTFPAWLGGDADV